MKNIYRLVYLSSASSLYSPAQLEDILTTSRRNNERSGITGILLYHDGSILQVLEGDALKVTNCYHRILLDDRHRGAMTIIEEPCGYLSPPASSALLITILTVSFQALKAAVANQVKSLRTE